MPVSITISIGYLNIPFIIKSSTRALTTEEEEEEFGGGRPRWTFGSTVSISCFVQSPPNMYPTVEKHVLELAPQSNHFEEETLVILSHAFEQSNKRIHGLITISDDLLGILSSSSAADQPTLFTLQIVQSNNDSNIKETKSYAETASESNMVPDMKQCAKPIEMMELCQLWPDSRDQLIKLAGQVYKMASLYGYWDYWRVFEGICSRHQINVDQLVNISSGNK
jgi:hypothetical protein